MFYTTHCTEDAIDQMSDPDSTIGLFKEKVTRSVANLPSPIHMVEAKVIVIAGCLPEFSVICQVYWPVVCVSLDDSELDFLKVLTLHTSSLLQALLRIAKFLVFEDGQFKWHSVSLVRFDLEMECVNEVLGSKVLFRDTLSEQVHVISYAYNAGIARVLLVEFVALRLENTNRAAFVLVLKMCLFD